MNTSQHIPRLAIIVPCYNEQEILSETNNKLSTLLSDMISKGYISNDSYIMYGDDGSYDSTWNIISSMVENDAHIEGLCLAGNVGHQNMLIALLDAVRFHCDIAVSIDADLQDDINVIPDMVKEYMRGNDIVLGVRDRRDSDSCFKRTTALLFYGLLDWLGVRSVRNHADFRLMSRHAIDILSEYEERNIYLRGVVCSLGLKQSSVLYNRGPRLAGESKYPLNKMINLALDGITSFSIKPVRLIFALGLLFLIVTLVIFVYVLINYFNGNTVAGWSSLILSIWFCSGILLMSLGIIGEYIGKIYTEVKHRPRYIVDKNTLIK